MMGTGFEGYIEVGTSTPACITQGSLFGVWPTIPLVVSTANDASPVNHDRPHKRVRRNPFKPLECELERLFHKNWGRTGRSHSTSFPGPLPYQYNGSHLGNLYGNEVTHKVFVSLAGEHHDLVLAVSSTPTRLVLLAEALHQHLGLLAD